MKIALYLLSPREVAHFTDYKEALSVLRKAISDSSLSVHAHYNDTDTALQTSYELQDYLCGSCPTYLVPHDTRPSLVVYAIQDAKGFGFYQRPRRA